MILVTGGAGYIGSNCTKLLLDRGEEVIILDNLSTGYKELIDPRAKFIEGDVGDKTLVNQILDQGEVEGIFHFAGSLSVEESTRLPALYYRNNVLNSLNLVECAIEFNVPHLIFSSTSAVYGDEVENPVRESMTCSPESPYGKSKKAVEWIIQDLAKAHQDKISFALLRYFNVAGASEDGRLGQYKSQALLKVMSEVATGQRKELEIYGDDYDTVDGTCVRDYIHVVDLCRAHLWAFDYLKKGGRSDFFNLGYGKGFSVKEMAVAYEKAIDQPIPKKIGPRRPGDMVAVYSNTDKIEKSFEVDWNFNDVEKICQSAFEFEKKFVLK